MCSGRVDLEFIFRAFANGQDGVLVGGCRLNECNYVTHGNYDALGNTYIARNIMERIGLNPQRLSIQFMSGGDGHLLAAVVDNFTRQVAELGPLGEAEGIERDELKSALAAARRLIPYLRLVEREKLRVPVRSEDGYRRFFESVEVNRLLDELVGAPLAISRIVSLLRNGPLSIGEISAMLRLSPSEVSKQINDSSRQGFVRYDDGNQKVSLAPGATSA